MSLSPEGHRSGRAVGEGRHIPSLLDIRHSLLLIVRHGTPGQAYNVCSERTVVRAAIWQFCRIKPGPDQIISAALALGEGMLNWENRKVMGVGGFLPSHLLNYLIQEEMRVRTFVHYNSRNDVGRCGFLSPGVFSQLEIIHGDLRNVEVVRGTVQNVALPFIWALDHDSRFLCSSV